MLAKLNFTLATVAIVASVLSSPLLAQIHAVVLSGDVVSNSPEQFVRVGGLALNDKGTVVFGATTTTSEGQNGNGFWAKDLSGVAEPIVLNGDQVFGFPPGVSFSSSPALHAYGNSGDVLIIGAIECSGDVENSNAICGNGPPIETRGIWRSDGQREALIARQGDVAPGLPEEAIFRSLVSKNLLNNRGEIAFNGLIVDATDTGLSGIWRTDDSGSVALVAIEGEQAAEIPNVENVTIPLGSPGLRGFNDNGTILLSARVYHEYLSVLPIGSTILSIAKPNEPRKLLARAQFLIPFEEIKATSASFRSIGSTALNNQEQVAAQVWLQGAGVVHPSSLTSLRPEAQSPPSNDRAIFAFEDGQEPKALIQSGNQPAGIENSNIVYFGFGGISPPFDNLDTFKIVDQPFGFNDSGQVLYRAILNSIEAEPTLDATNDEGLWISDMHGNDRLILREGDLAPGISEPFVLGGTSFDYSLNNLGQVAIETSVGGKKGIWATDLENNIQLIAIEGQSMDLGPNDTRVIDRLFTRLFHSRTMRSQPILRQLRALMILANWLLLLLSRMGLKVCLFHI